MTTAKRMTCRPLLAVTALAEAGTGVALLGAPAVPLRLLLGVDAMGPELALTARIAGAALIAIGVACWLGRKDPSRPALLGLLTGVLLYDLTAAMLLGHAGSVLGMSGVALWPAVALHAVLAVWCIVCIRDQPRDGDAGPARH